MRADATGQRPVPAVPVRARLTVSDGVRCNLARLNANAKRGGLSLSLFEPANTPREKSRAPPSLCYRGSSFRADTAARLHTSISERNARGERPSRPCETTFGSSRLVISYRVPNRHHVCTSCEHHVANPRWLYPKNASLSVRNFRGRCPTRAFRRFLRVREEFFANCFGGGGRGVIVNTRGNG